MKNRSFFLKRDAWKRSLAHYYYYFSLYCFDVLFVTMSGVSQTPPRMNGIWLTFWFLSLLENNAETLLLCHLTIQSYDGELNLSPVITSWHNKNRFTEALWIFSPKIKSVLFNSALKRTLKSNIRRMAIRLYFYFILSLVFGLQEQSIFSFVN